jgi:predicted secreted hydrolase
MLFRLRQTDGNSYSSGNWISPDGKTEEIVSADIRMTPKTSVEIEGRKIPVAWDIAIPRLKLSIAGVPLNARSWMGTSFPYWEGPISFGGSHSGVGYLEMTGY